MFGCSPGAARKNQEAAASKQKAADKKAADEAEKKKAAQRAQRLKEIAEEERNVEVRYGMRINPNPAVALRAPKAPPALSPDEEAARQKRDVDGTSRIESELDRYVEIVRDVSLFSEMGDEELQMAARALEVCTFRPGEVIFDEGVEGREAWVLEEGTVISSVLCPGIAGAGWEWKETRPYKPGKTGSFFGERGLRRGEPRAVRMTCLTAVKALRITQANYVACARLREYKENLLRGVQLFEQMTDDQIGKLAAIMKLVKYKPGETIYKAGEVRRRASGARRTRMRVVVVVGGGRRGARIVACVLR